MAVTLIDSATSPARLLGLLRRHPIWQRADDMTLRALIARGRVVDAPASATVLRSGEPATAVHLLLEGAVRVYYPATAKRDELTVKLFGAPAVFGDAECVARSSWNETVEALIPSRLLVVPAADYMALLQRDAAACFGQYWEVARQFAVAIAYEQSANTVVERVIAILIAYATQFGTSVRDGVRIDHALTQDDLARQSGSTRRTVVRTLATLYDAGLVRRVGRRYRIAPITELLAYAGGGRTNIAVTADRAPWARRD